jgi:dethiobiotin synthetase/adenosylmethionine--8-amino-7-oxononanoate aminotransferase
MDIDQSGKWQAYKKDWSDAPQSQESGTGVWSVWSKRFIHAISMSKDVESVVALGSVLAIALHDEQAGYSSSAASGLQKRMLEGSAEFNVHSRVLGNVFYLMASQTSNPETLAEIERLLTDTLVKS